MSQQTVMSMRMEIPLGNGTRRTGEILATLKGDPTKIVEAVRDGRIKAVEELVAKGTIVLEEGVEPVEIFNGMNNHAVCHIGPRNATEKEPGGPIIDPSLRSGDGDDWRDSPIASIETLNPNALKALESAEPPILTLGDIESFLADGKNLQALDGIGEATEKIILTHIAAVRG